ncbi:hypothetical protein BDN70DRAFT_991165 [Pholiota conissans]|uniref:Uncharacterized protein n=1 Tax=Pholiota conissans TaxID=109636 RepID=A0A9P5Z7P8_9AGAR|nr:hypothetical protein BDN70DRAFT_991165 [Pholiota conissans]
MNAAELVISNTTTDRKTKKRPRIEHELELEAARSTLSHSRPVNAQGLPCLADELYLEIMSYFPAYPMPTTHSYEDMKKYGYRRLVLDALSQTCQSLRRVFLRYRWQRIEVYPQMRLGSFRLPGIQYKNGKATANTRYYAEELVKQLETVTVREPALAELVNVMDIFVSDYSVKNVVKELARCIALMPSLHTVQIHFDFSNTTGINRDIITTAFESYTYPQIQTAYLSVNAHSFLEHCPNVKVVNALRPLDVENQHWSYPGFSMGNFWEMALRSGRSCSAVTTIGPIRTAATAYSYYSCLADIDESDLTAYARLFEMIENLQNVAFLVDKPPSFSSMRALRDIPSLQTLRIIFCRPRRGDHERLQEIKEWKMRMAELFITPSQCKMLSVTFTN